MIKLKELINSIDHILQADVVGDENYNIDEIMKKVVNR